MGRTRLAKALVSSLQRNKEASQKRKEALVDYLKRLNQAHVNQKISGAEYVETLYKKNNGRNIKEWVDYYDNYSKNCEKAIQRQNAQIIRNRVLIFFFGAVLLAAFFWMAFSINYSDVNFTGLFVGEGFQEKEYSQIIGLISNNSTNYEWRLENPGQLSSVKINGEIEGEGEVKIYLNDLLVLDSSKIKSKSKKSILTGSVIEETTFQTTTADQYSDIETPSKEESSPSPEEPLTETQTAELSSLTQDSYSENEILPKEESSPSQEESQPSETNQSTSSSNNSYSEQEDSPKEESQEELLTENQTQIINETIPASPVSQTNVTGINESYSEQETPSKEESSPSQEGSLPETIFTDICEDTCDLEKLNLTNSSYNLRIEIDGNANVTFGSIDYSIIQQDILQEEINLTENLTINTIQYEAVLGQPVKWKKQIELPEKGSVNIELPNDAENIVVNKIIESYSEQETPSKEESSPSQREPLTENKQIKEKGESIEVSIDDNATEYEIEYETPAPYANEEKINNGKKITIAGSEEIHYENVLAFTDLDENLSITTPSDIKIYWVEENTFIIPTSVQDKNNNEIYDYIEWIVPHLSNQTFLITIQPDSSEGKDSYLNGGAQNTNYGTDTVIDVNYATSNRYRGLIEFDLSDVTSAANIVNANLTLYLSSTSGTNIPINIQRINQSWAEGEVTWNNRSSTGAWDSAGGDFSPFVWATNNVSTADSFYTWDVTQLVQNWINGTYPNYGIILMAGEGNGQWQFASSDNINATIRPQLNITYNESQIPTINSVNIPSTIREGESISLTANITDNLEVSNAVIEINNENYSLGQNPQTVSNIVTIRPIAKGTIEVDQVLNYPNTYDNNNGTYAGINDVTSLLAIKTPGVSATGDINSVKMKIIHSRAAYDTSGSVHWAINSTTQGLIHEFNSTSESLTLTEFDVTSERTWSFSDFNLLTEIHLNNSGNTLRVYEIWFEVNYTTPASNDLWNGTIDLSALSPNNYTYTIFANDSSDNVGTKNGNLTVLPQLVLVNVSMNDAQGNFQQSDVLIYNSENQEVEMNSTMTEAQLISVEEGEKDILINTIGNIAMQIEYENATINETLEGIIDIDEPDLTGNFTEIYALNPHLTTNATVTTFATGNELYKCKDWNFTNQSCYGEWVKVMDITPGEAYNFTLTPEDPAFAEVIVIVFAYHLNSTRDFISDIYEEVVTLDDIWSEEIPDGDYVRVTFERNITSDKDITIYPRIVSGTPIIEVYEVNQSTLLAEFNPVVNDTYNKIYLTNLTGEQDTFDLLINGGTLQFDHIVDPTSTYDFNDRINNKAYNGSDANPVSYFTGSELPQAGYTLISSNNVQNATTVGTNNNYYVWFRFEFHSNQSVGTINWINLGFIGSENGDAGATLYVYNWTSNSRQSIGVIPAARGVLQLNVTSTYGIQSIVGANGNITLIADSDSDTFDGGEYIYVDYVNMTIDYTPDSTPPTYSLNSTNNTVAGQPTKFSINVTDNAALHPNGGYIFEFDNGNGTFYNNSFVLFTTTPSWANVTKTLNSTVGTTVRYRWYFNDSYTTPNYNSTPVYNFVTTQGDILSPNITFEPPTPDNASSTSSPVTIVANISDASNTSSWIDFDRSLLGYWAMDYYNATVIFDNSSYHQNASIEGGGINFLNVILGKRGNALDFNGTTQSLMVPNSGILDFPISGSVSLWVNLTSIESFDMPLWRGGSSAGEAGYDFELGTGDWNSGISNGTAYINCIYSDVPLVGWNMLTFTFNTLTNNFTCYVNGEYTDHADLTGFGGIYSTDEMHMGSISGSYPINGSLDEVMIFNRSLSQTEIKALYNSQINKFNTSAMNLADGKHNYTVYAIDENGNTNNSGERNFVVSSDSTLPTITFEPPTPDNDSSTSSPVTIVANISDASNTSSWVDLDRSLLGYWAMDYYNATGIFDNSSYKKNGTFVGGLNYSNLTTGKRGQALRFDGSNDDLSLGLNSLHPNANISIFLWLNPANVAGGEQQFFTLYGTPDPQLLKKSSGSSDLELTLFDATYQCFGGAISATNVFTNNQWVHVGYTRYGNYSGNYSNYTLYVNGVAMDSDLCNGTLLRYEHIGSYFNTAFYWNGSIDEAMLFNRTLSTTEINALYSSQIYKFNTTISNLVDGQHNYTVYAIDEAGNVNNSGERNFVVSSGPADCTTIGNSGTLDTANTIYTLTENISSTGTCLAVAAANVTIDCNGYWINYSIGGASNTRGVYTNQLNTTVKNCNLVDGNRTSGNSGRDGIYFNGADRGLSQNNSVNVSNNYGIILDSTSNSTILNSTSYSVSSTGIHMSGSNNSVSNSTGISNSGYGIRLGGSSNNISYSEGHSNSSYGIYITSDYSKVYNSKGRSNFSYGIYSNGNPDYNNISNSEAISDNVALSLEYFSHGSIHNFTANSTSAYGVYLLYSANNTLSNLVSFSSSSVQSVTLESSYNNTLANSSCISNGDKCIFLYNTSNNTFVNNTLFGESADLLYIDATSGNNLIYWNNFTQTTGHYVEDSNGTNYYNTTISGNGEGNIWYNVIDGSVSISGAVNSVGYPSLYIGSSGTGYPYNTTNSENKIRFDAVDYAPLTSVSSGPADCTTVGNSGTLDNANTIYTLTENISSSGTCLTVSAANVTIDCNGYWIIFSTGGAEGTRGISSNQFNTTVKNCKIIDGNWTTPNSWRAGVFFTVGTDYGLIQNVSTNVSNCHGIDINGGSSIRVLNSTGRTGSYYGIIIWTDASNITLINSTGISNTSNGIGIFGNNNSIYNSTGQSTYDGYGFYLDSASNNIISGSNASSYLDHGIYMSNSTNDTFIKNNVTSNSANGIVMNSYSSNNTLIDNNATANAGTGIYILGFSNNNTLLRNIARSESTFNHGIYIYNSSYTNLTENTGISISGYGIILDEVSENSTLKSNNGTSYAADMYGINLGTSSNNILINNTGMNVNNGIGIYIAGSSNNNTLINNTGISITGQGIYLFSNYNNTFINQRASGNLGIFMVNVNWTTFRDCIDISGTTFDVNLFSTPLSKNNTFINCSYDSETVGGTDNELIRKWYYQAYVNDSGGTAISDANITAYNTTGQIQFTAQTNSSGLIGRQEVTEYVNIGGTRSFYNNYSITANKSGYTNDSNEFNFTITQNKMDDVFTLGGGVDITKPIITFEEPPTPENGSTVTSSNQTLVANISDQSNTSSWMDFDRSLVGYWAMDYYNATGIFDNSTYGYNATFYGGLNYSNLTTGMRGQSLQFDGSNDYMTSNLSKSSFNSAVSLSLFMKPTGAQSNRGVLQFGDEFNEPTPWILLQRTNPTTVRWYVDQGYRITQIANDDEYVHLVLTYNGTAWTAYKNGIINGTYTASNFGADPGASFWMGNGYNGFFNGTLDEVMFFNRALSQEEVLALYNSQLNNFNTTLTSLSNDYHNYTVYAIDEAGNTNNSGERNFIVNASLDCGILNTAGQTYTLTQNVSSNGTCFTLAADNITLDCNNYWINYSIGGDAFTYGIFLNDQLNATIKNCNVIDGNWSYFNATDETRIGIYLYYTHNSTLYNNFVNSSDSQGFEIFGNFNNLTNNTGISNSSVGIRVYYGRNSLLMDNLGISNSSFGIWLFGQENTTAINNTGISTTAAGIRIYGENVNNTLINNTGISTNGDGNYAGIILTWTSNNTLINNNGTSDSTYGIYLLASSNNTLINNTGTSIADNGIYLYESNDNNLTNNLGKSTENRGIYLSGSNNTYLYNNTGISSDFSAIQLSYSLHSTLIKNNASGGSIGYGVYGSNNTLIRDCIYTYGSSYDVTLDNTGGSFNNTFINCTYTLARERVTAGNELIRKWYYQTYVNDSSGTAVENANITAYNTTGIIQFTAQTNSTGHISRKEVIEYVNTGGTRVFYNNYTIFANKSGYINDSNVFNFTITQNKVNDWFTLEAGEADCTTIGNSGILDTANNIYTLTENISSNGTCLQIPAANVTLDCNGYWINYSIGGASNNYGIVTVAFNTTIKNCNVVDGNWTTSNTGRNGIYLAQDSTNATVYNNYIYVNTSSALSIYRSNFSNLSNNRALSNNSYGISLNSAYNNNLINNTGTSNSVSGILLYNFANNNMLINNTGIGTSSTSSSIGIRIYDSCNNNTLINQTGISYGSGYGLFVDTSSNTTLINSTGTSNSGQGIRVAYSSYTNLINPTGTTFGTTGSRYGVFIYQSNNSLFRDCINISGASSDVSFWSSPSINNTFINCSYRTDQEDLYVGEELIRKWYYQAYVNDSGGTAISDANITAYNTTGQIQFTAQTNSSGLIGRQEVIEYNNTGGTRSYYNNYTIFANKTGYINDSNIFNFTTQQNKVDDYFTLEGGLDCGDSLNGAGETYTLTNNVSSTGTCFTIDAANITLDCNNYWITYSTLGNQWDYGIYSNQFNTTIKNCNIIDGNWANSNTSRAAIYYSGVINGTIQNNSINVSNTLGILLNWESSNTTLIENKAYSNSNVAIDIYNSSNNLLTNNTGTSNSSNGIAIQYCSNNTLINNTGTSNSSYGVYILHSNNTNLTNNNGTSTSNYGIILYESDNNNLLNNNGTCLEDNSGIYLDSSSENNLLIGNLGTSLGDSNGIALWTSNNNTLINNTGVSDTSAGVLIAYSLNTSLINNTGTSNEARGIFISNSNNTVLTDNTGISNGTGYGIILYDSINNTLRDNLGTSNLSVGIILDGSSNNLLINNTGINTQQSQGFLIYSSSNNNTLINNTGRNLDYGNRGLYISDCLNNTLINQIGTGTRGIAISGSNHTLIRDCINVTGRTNDVYVNDASNNVTFINCSYNYTPEYVGADSELIRKWYYQAYINDSGGTVIEDANITAYNTTGVIQFTAQTNSSGLIGRQELIEYNNTGGTRSYYNNYSIFANKSGYINDSNQFNFTLTQNKMNDLFTLNQEIVGENSCGTLNVAGQSYTLTENVSSQETCFTIGADNITLDCNGYWINYSIDGINYRYGVHASSRFNATVKNCNIINGNLTSPNTGRYGIFFSNTDNSTIYNNSINTNNSRAIYIYNGADYNNITLNTGGGNTYPGINLESSSYNTLLNNTFTSNSNPAIYIYLCSNITLINTTGIGNTSAALHIAASSNTIINYLTARTTGTSGSRYGIYFSASNNTIIQDCVNISGATADVYYSSISINNTFINCSYNTAKETVQPVGSQLIRKWYYQAYVNDSSGTAVEDANVTVYNTTGIIQFTAQTNSTGWIQRKEVIEYNNTGGTRSYYNNYTIFANKTGYVGDINVFNFTITQNKVDDVFTLDENTPPQIIKVYNSTEMTDISSGPNEGPVATYVLLNFTAYDEQGFGNLDDSSVQVNFSLAGESPRVNSSCAWLGDYNTNYANYTCNVTMWWWDAPGTWTINASIEDNEGNSGFNDSTTFAVGSTTGFLANSTSVNWPSIGPGATNIEALSPMLLNNTGNEEINVEVNATNLTGENNPAYVLGASNFSVHTVAGCGGTGMRWYQYTAVVGAVIPKGNCSLNDGTAQETIYFCLEESNANLISQAYSTQQQGAWTIRIFLALVTIRRRRKKKVKTIEKDKLLKAINLVSEELKEEYSPGKEEIVNLLIKEVKRKYRVNNKEISELIFVRKDIEISMDIFTKDLGALEALTKYMKENLHMNYVEIANKLGRDERTIWTAYKKAVEKNSEPIKIKEDSMNIPIQIFYNEKLTVLEAIIIYLKEKGKKYSEIGRLLNRDQRNIWTIYSKAIDKK
ncbi:MAG: right-handed parallel beta-helix repeat-containing protein [Nanobdellota archaeon]